MFTQYFYLHKHFLICLTFQMRIFAWLLYTKRCNYCKSWIKSRKKLHVYRNSYTKNWCQSVADFRLYSASISLTVTLSFLSKHSSCHNKASNYFGTAVFFTPLKDSGIYYIFHLILISKCQHNAPIFLNEIFLL